MSPIFFLTGSPAAGKTTLAKAILQGFEFGLHIPVDDLREWVVSGIAHPINWSEETTRQFTLAENAACDLAIRYQDAGFAVVIDHCQGPPTLDKLVEARLGGRLVHKIARAPNLEINLERNRTRGNKPFDCSFLDVTIEKLNPLYRTAPIHEQGWIVFDNGGESPEESAKRILNDLLPHSEQS